MREATGPMDLTGAPLDEALEELAIDPVLDPMAARIEAEAEAPSFPALAEVHRRAGRAEEAERVARQGIERWPTCYEGRVVLSLALLDQGRLEEARHELERWADEALPAHARAAAPMPAEPAEPELEIDALEDADGALSELELDRAFDEAEADTAGMVSADSIAEEALAEAERSIAADAAEPGPFAPEPESAFATETVAELLERQGHADDASRIRAALGETGRDHAIETLEGWLDNLRRGRP